MTPGTYSTHLKHTYARLGVESRTAAVACALTKAWSTRRTRHVGKVRSVFALPVEIDQQAPLFQRATQDCMKVQPSSLTINNQRPGGS